LIGLLSTDDFLLAITDAQHSVERKVCEQEFSDRFEITTDEGRVFLSVKIEQTPETISLSMPTKIAELKEMMFPDLGHDEYPDEPVLEAFMPSWSELESDKCSPCDPHLYQQGTGLSIFITKARHDSQIAVSFLAGRMHCATTMDMDALLHLAKYLCYTRDLRMVFYRGTQVVQQALEVIGGADAAFRAHVRTSQSHLATGFKLAEDTNIGMDSKSGMFWVTSRSSKGLVPLNVASSEVAAAVEATRYAINLEQLLVDDFAQTLGGPIVIEEDNEATVLLGSDFSNKSKGLREVSASINFLKSANTMGHIRIEKVGTKDQAVNQLTKAQGALANCRDLPKLMGVSAVAQSMLHQASVRFSQRARVLPVVSAAATAMTATSGTCEGDGDESVVGLMADLDRAASLATHSHLLREDALAFMAATLSLDVLSDAAIAQSNMRQLTEDGDDVLQAYIRATIAQAGHAEEVPLMLVQDGEEKAFVITCQQRAREDRQRRLMAPRCAPWSNLRPASTVPEQNDRRLVQSSTFVYPPAEDPAEEEQRHMEDPAALLLRTTQDQDSNHNPIPLPASGLLPSKSCMRSGASLVMRSFQRVKWGVQVEGQSVHTLDKVQGQPKRRHKSPCNQRSRDRYDERRNQIKLSKLKKGGPV
jgi:hypothetical protein